MQVLWGKLLAGEIKKPGSFSLRTLSTLKTMSQQEAEIFNECSQFVLKCKSDTEGLEWDYFLMDNDMGTLLNSYDIPFSKIMVLDQAGLITSNSTIHIFFTIDPNNSETIYGHHKAINIKNNGDKQVRVDHSAYIFTQAGNELLTLTSTAEAFEKSNSYMECCVGELRKSIYNKQILFSMV